MKNGYPDFLVDDTCRTALFERAAMLKERKGNAAMNNDNVCWAELLYAPGIDALMHGDLGAPRAIRIPESDLVEMTAEARITGTAVSDVARNRIATALLDGQEPTTEIRSRQIIARFLRQAMLRAVNMSDVDLAKHIKVIATIPGVSFAEHRVFEIEAHHRQAEADLRWSLHQSMNQAAPTIRAL